MSTWWKEVVAGGILLALLAVCAAHQNTVDDARLYYEVAGEALGRPFDAEFIEGKRSDDAPVALPPGALPYRDFTVEYPPLALGVFILPRLLTDDVRAYHWIFQGTMAGVVLGLTTMLWLLLRKLQPGLAKPELRAMVLALLFVLFAGPYILRRFDLLVAATVVASALAALHSRRFLAGLFLGTAAALKLWPLLLLPMFGLYDMRRRAIVPLLLGFALVPVISHLALAPAIGGEVLNYLSYHGARGIQLESLWSSILMLGGKLASSPPGVEFDHGAMDLVMPSMVPTALWVAHIVAAVTLAACYVLAFLAMRRARPADRPTTFISCLVLMTAALLVTGKMLSPQYLIWLFPLAVALPHRSITATYLAAVAVTHVFYPGIYLRYEALEAMTWSGILILLTRNLLLVALVALAFRATVRRWPDGARDAAAAPASLATA